MIKSNETFISFFSQYSNVVFPEQINQKWKIVKGIKRLPKIKQNVNSRMIANKYIVEI